MTFKAFASALAISSAMLLGGQAYAETMVGGMSVSDANLPKVQERCDQLALADSTASPTDTTIVGTDDTGGATVDAPVEPVNEMANATAETIDLESITLDACKAAGLTK
ncbi:MAG TPA: hypothetical protein VL133_09820 [Devosia sp.]|nr:hypothetical protein [Devosia sp.]